MELFEVDVDAVCRLCVAYVGRPPDEVTGEPY